MEKVIGKPILKIQLIGQFYENLIPLHIRFGMNYSFHFSVFLHHRYLK